ncbi:DNA-directed RNA polymerase subunit beta [Rickettsiales endosymbiont of Peranema trichophorum]|nr:DNA-directed RNA polymerase subunit beta [Rickettsiales endosymbiont of Peranema trichophorum]
MSISSLPYKRRRKCFGQIKSVAEIPNLIHVQKASYEEFLQIGRSVSEREDKGLESVFRSVFPVADYEGKAVLEYLSYDLDRPKYDIDECGQRGVNYAAPLKVKLRLIVWDIDEEAGTRDVKGIKEQDVYIGEIPLMTDRGTFIINGAERVVVSQMHRSPGVFYFHDGGKASTSGKYLYYARIIPYRGSWLDVEFDIKDLLYFRIDRKRKIYITSLLKALGFTKDQILSEFYSRISYRKFGEVWVTKLDPERLRAGKVYFDVVDAKTGDVIIKADTKVTPRLIKSLMESEQREYVVPLEELVGSYIAEDIINPVDGEVIMESGDEITQNILDRIDEAKIEAINILNIDYIKTGPYIRNTLVLDKNMTQDEALADIYKVMRPGEPSTPEAAHALFNSVFFDKDKYDLSPIGRMKINVKHGLDIPETQTILTREDVVAIIKHIIQLKDGVGSVDDIDNLANRRIRSVGELVENQFRLGLVRMSRVIIERMGAIEIDSIMPHDLVNSKVLMSVLKEFFGTSQLSQFMDQTNPLSEITHKRRLSALGPGGLTRDRAGFEVRDVHTTHYGRICPIETPEGTNVGLINSLACYARINKYGFLESPYRKVVDGKVTDEVHYLSAIEESKYVVASSTKLKNDQTFTEDMVKSRCDGEIIVVPPERVDFIDVSPKQIVSVAASLIPFLENDDASRALMGSNMQRQAVPLMKAQAPFVGTGMEAVVARDSGATVVAKREGVVDRVDANRIVIRTAGSGNEGVGVDIYTLMKYKKSNQNTCINQRPIVKLGDKVKKGDIIADGPSTDNGELALGRNILVAFMPWNGYNYEDSILLSENVVRKDDFTSIHIQEFEVVARDTRLGAEEITRDIPNVSEENLRHLDEVGVVHIGAEVKPGDILVGKVTPKSESPITPEEKLLRAIFGEKAADVRDSSLRVPPDARGTVVGVRVFTRRGIEKDERAISLERREIDSFIKDKDDELNIIQGHAYTRVCKLLLNQIVVTGPKNFKKGQVISNEMLSELQIRLIWQVVVEDNAVMEEIATIKALHDDYVEDLEDRFKKKVEKLQSGDDLLQGALKVVKVYLATKLKIQPGDKMAGRHGNKGVVSRIVPVEDMPFLEDGTPVDVVLNPLGVPSRMNVGQILETHLGWASANIGKQISQLLDKANGQKDVKKLRKYLLELYQNDADAVEEISGMEDIDIKVFAGGLSSGMYFSTPVFCGAKEDDISQALEFAGVEASGQVSLIDGRSGEYFHRKVTVGYIYMMKLDHLVDDKIHARSIGPYSLVTQQPLGGKSHFGGQRFGEMECWALQAYGAAYTLQEMLTVKSDDITGRIKMYDAIVRGDASFDAGIPESFNVMVKELRSLCLNIHMKRDNDDVA